LSIVRYVQTPNWNDAPGEDVSAVGNALYSVGTAIGSSATQPQQQERVMEEQCEQEDGKNNQKARKSKKKEN
jgi:hypothetical protein